VGPVDGTIPVVDITAFADTAGLGAALGQAARDIGFFCITGHGIAPSLTEALFAQSRQFFALGGAAKDALSIRHSPHNRGYVALGEERLDASKPGDVKSAFNIGLDLPVDHPDVLAGQPFRGVNVWPDAAVLPRFRGVMLEYFDACHQLGMRRPRVRRISNQGSTRRMCTVKVANSYSRDGLIYQGLTAIFGWSR
jgi:isopenicillin N synthase-like dioxygenase